MTRRKIFLAVAVLFMFMPVLSYSAVFSISPSANNVSEGDVLTESIKINTENQAVNAVQTTVHFPSDKLKLISAVPGTIFNLLTPNSPLIEDGKVTFSAGVVSPGFTGSAGSILTLKFLILEQGLASLSLDNGKALLNDGLGTDSLNKSIGANISISPKKIVPVSPAPITTAPIATVPVKTIISKPVADNTVTSNSVEVSSNLSDQTKWYATSTLALSWTKPQKVFGFSFILDQDQQGVPDDVLDTTITTNKTYQVADGTWYFHIKTRGLNKNSRFSDVVTYQANVDTVAPSQPDITLAATSTPKGSGFIASFNSHDDTSGVVNYRISLDDTFVKNTASSTIVFAPLYPGEHKIDVVAFDNAGNQSSSTVFVIAPNIESGNNLNNNIVIILLAENSLLLILVAMWVYFFRKHHTKCKLK